MVHWTASGHWATRSSEILSSVKNPVFWEKKATSSALGESFIYMNCIICKKLQFVLFSLELGAFDSIWFKQWLSLKSMENCIWLNILLSERRKDVQVGHLPVISFDRSLTFYVFPLWSYGHLFPWDIFLCTPSRGGDLTFSLSPVELWALVSNPPWAVRLIGINGKTIC